MSIKEFQCPKCNYRIIASGSNAIDELSAEAEYLTHLSVHLNSISKVVEGDARPARGQN